MLIVGNTLILGLFAAGVLNDLWARKYSNKLFVFTLTLSLISAFLFSQTPAHHIGISISVAFVVGFSLYAARVFGAGDGKLIIALSPLLAYEQVIWMVALSAIWGLTIGVFQMLYSGMLPKFIKQVLRLTFPQHRTYIPYTVALMMGWMSHNVLQTGSLW